MDIIPINDGKTWIHRLEPRARLLGAAVLSITLSQSMEIGVLLIGVGLGVFGVILARIPLAALLQRLLPLNVLVAFLWGTLLFSVPGESTFRVASVVATREGFAQGGIIFLKSNGIVLLLTCLIGTIEFVALGKALRQLGAPQKLVHLLLFTVRYINLMLTEYERMSRAALLRGFRPGANMHTLRTTGYMVGMVLVRSYERGAQMLQAMKLRGYDGTLSFIESNRFCARDYLFLVGVFLVVATVWGRAVF